MCLKVEQGVLFILASCVAAGAATAELEYFKEFSSTLPTNYLIEFTDSKNLNFLTNDLVITNQDGSVLKLPVQNKTYRLVIWKTPDFLVAGSSLPLERGFVANADFSAAGVVTNRTWSLSPVGQIHYYLDRINKETQNGRTQPRAILAARSTAERVATLGIDAQIGTIAWTGNSFRAIGGSGRNVSGKGAEVFGELVVSNGLPAMASYRSGADKFDLVTYSFSRHLEVPFPSSIQIRRFVTKGATTNLVSTEILEVTDIRRTLTTQDQETLSPKYFADKSDQSVQEFLVSNGVTIAAIRNENWLYSKSLPPQPRSGARRAIVVILLVMSVIPFVVYGYRNR